ncbi:MAG: hypothetical protein D3914_01520 [Candidatus Electrothrix sp. LOE2]|nr:hypothetical protein [Candidatus Electrothrix sp. LOE2]
MCFDMFLIHRFKQKFGKEKLRILFLKFFLLLRIAHNAVKSALFFILHNNLQLLPLRCSSSFFFRARAFSFQSIVI